MSNLNAPNVGFVVSSTKLTKASDPRSLKRSSEGVEFRVYQEPTANKQKMCGGFWFWV